MPLNLSLIRFFFHALPLRQGKESSLKSFILSRTFLYQTPKSSRTLDTQQLLSPESVEYHAHLKHISTFNSSANRITDWKDTGGKMFTSKGLFSDIVCPYQEKCLLPGCMFSHPKPTESVPALATISINEPQKEKPIPEKQGRNAKPHIEPGRTMTTKGTNDLLKTALVPKERVFVGEPVSPPPLRRKALNGNTIPVAKQPPKSAAPAPLPKVIQPPKKEGLNPRALKTIGWLFHLLR